MLCLCAHMCAMRVRCMFSLTHHRTQDSFWTLVCLMTTYGCGGMFRPGLPRFQLLTFQFDMLLKKTFPKLKKHLESQGVASSMYSSQWFITLFSYAFPFDLVVRVWDIFMAEGWKIVLRVALAIMKLGYSTWRYYVLHVCVCVCVHVCC